MTARSTMTMRATVKRDTSRTDSTVGWGGDRAPRFEEVATNVACRVWTKTRTDKDDDGKSAVIEEIGALVPVGANVQEGDRLDVTDRHGQPLFDGPLAVETKHPGGGPQSRRSYFKLGLVRHKGGT